MGDSGFGGLTMGVARTPVTCTALLALAVSVLPSGGPAAGEPVASLSTVSARTLLGRLAVAGERGSSTYERELFPHWVDANGDCQDTRAEVLITESKTTVSFTSTSHCSVAKGRWYSWYDGATWTRPADVDIDHMVPLKEAWESGARSWTTAKRRRYANDLYGPSLVAVTDNVNQSKGDRDPAQWLPARNKCLYAKRWVQVKYRWRLTINTAERSTLSRVLSGSCGAGKITVPTRAS